MAEDPVRALLAVQEIDSALDRLHHRRQTLPERRELAEAEAATATVAAELAATVRRAEELGGEIRRREDEVAANEARVASLEATLDSGSGGAPRDLAAMADEVQAVRRRIRSLEDALLDLLEEAEVTAASQAELQHRRDERAVDVARASEAVATADAELDAEEAELVPQRAGLVEGVPDDLVRTYERLRKHLGGVAVALLDGTRCSGCHLTLPATELDALRHAAPGTVVRHDECGRILVRP
jgi:predicted  nucleic acid-binding Zn-ribbon protein